MREKSLPPIGSEEATLSVVLLALAGMAIVLMTAGSPFATKHIGLHPDASAASVTARAG